MYCTKNQENGHTTDMTRAPVTRPKANEGGAATSARPPPHPQHYAGHGFNNRYHRMPPPALKFSSYNCRFYPYYDFPR